MGTDIEAFQCGTHAQHIAVVVGIGLAELVVEHIEVAQQHGIASEVAQIAPDERLSEESLGLAPHLGLLAKIVQQHHTSLWHRGEIRPQSFGSPLLLFIIEHPRHLQPSGIRVHLL